MNILTSYSDILTTLKRIEIAESAKLMLISDITLEPIFSQTLKVVLYETLAINMMFEHVGMGDFLQRDLSARPLNSDYIAIMVDFKPLLNPLIEVKEIIDPMLNYLKAVVMKIRESTHAPILMLIPEQSVSGLNKNLVAALRERLITFCQRKNCYTIDLTNALIQVGAKHFYDYRALFTYNFPYSFQGCLAISSEISKELKKMAGKYKKCIVLDCDNVLWGGILDEVSMEGIKLDVTYPGNQYLHFQEYLLKLHACGVILTICSKNNEDDVLDVIRKHPFMLIKENHLAAYRINWFNKVDNISEIARELNISIDSVVFIDDSLFEINLVKAAHPQLQSIQFDIKKPYEMVRQLEQLDLFKTDNLTSDDLTRNVSYRVEKQRRQERDKYIDYEKYLDSLQIRLEGEPVDAFNANRLSQLTMRTNKGNLTCRKYQVAEILKLSEDPSYWIRCFKLSDKFGEYGYIGALIVRVGDDCHTRIEGFYLSCRAFGRNIEHRMLDNMLSMLGGESIKIDYTYVANGKNEEFNLFVQEYLSSRTRRSANVVE